MAKEQVTVPKDVREVLGVASGDHISFIVEGGTVHIANSAVYAMQMLQREMSGEAESSLCGKGRECKIKSVSCLGCHDHFIKTPEAHKG